MTEEQIKQVLDFLLVHNIISANEYIAILTKSLPFCE